DSAALGDLDPRDEWAMEREDSFHADTGGDPADGHGRLRSVTVAAPDDETFEDLDPLLTTFADAQVDPDGVTGADIGELLGRQRGVEFGENRGHWVVGS